MYIFEHTIKVETSDLDQLNHVNNVRYVAWVQDLAKSHWEQNASEAIRKRYFWVLLEHHIQYKKSAVLHDEIIAKTYVLKSEGVSSVRQVDFLHAKTQLLLATSKTTWCLMDSTTKRPVRIPLEIIKLF